MPITCLHHLHPFFKFQSPKKIEQNVDFLYIDLKNKWNLKKNLIYQLLVYLA